MIPIDTKQNQRRAGCYARRCLTAEQRNAASSAICAALSVNPAVTSADVVLAYRAMPSEVDLSAFCSAAHVRGQRIAYPYCSAPGQMDAYFPGDAPWQPDNCGMYAPRPSPEQLAEPESIGIILVPLTVFDAECRRTGMGGGFYDRFLPACTHAKKFGIAFSVQQAERVTDNSWDVRLDGIFTESRIFLRNSDEADRHAQE